jgi:hypothetical protein
MTDDLVAFLRERLDEDERIARPATPGPTPGPWRYSLGKQWHAPEDLPTQANPEEFVAAGHRDDPVCVAVTGPAGDPQSIADALHIARHDPARVLAGVESTRQLLQWYEKPEESAALTDSFNRFNTSIQRSVLAQVFRHLAQAYADHPDYREEWRP